MKPTPHRIRLRRPWQRRDADGRLCYARYFHRPTGIGPQDRVRLVLAGLEGTVELRLNGEQRARFEATPGAATAILITPRLAERNHLELLISAATAAVAEDEPPGEVWLEIEPGAGGGNP